MIHKYQRQGQGAPFVYIPGLEGSGKLFYKQAQDLARDHTVITFPSRRDGWYVLQDLVDDLVGVVRDAGFERVTALGESLGGAVLMAAAHAHPHLFERMILVNTFPFFANRRKINAGVALFSFLPYSLLRAHRNRSGARDLFGDDVPAEDRRAFRELTGDAICEGYQSRLRIIRDVDLRERLKEINVPALVVAGTDDRVLDAVSAARLIASGLPRARLKILEGAGHIVLLSGRVMVRDWLKEFDTI